MQNATSQSRGRRFVRYHLPVILYGVLVISLSLIPNLTTPKLRVIQTDKIAHFIEYALFAFLILRSFSNLGAKVSPRRAFWLSLAFLILFALADENVQRFTPGRDPNIADYAFDLAGGVLVLGLKYFWLRRQAEKPLPEPKKDE